MNLSNLRDAALAGALLLALPAAAKDGYAEGVYRDFVAMHQGSLRIEIKAAESAPLDRLAGRDMQSLTGFPQFSLLVDDESDFRLPTARYVETNRDDLYLQDLAASVDGFAKVGYPLELGDYRLLTVSTEVDGLRQQHVAVEFCWNSLGHCVVFDPSIDFLDSTVNSYRAARAEGWALQIHEDSEVDLIGGDTRAKARCGLASNPSVTARSYSRGARTVTYKNLYGITMVQKTVGAVQAGLRCSSTCAPSPFGYANASSAWSNIPFSVQCGNRANSGTSGGRGKFVAKSGCAHRTVLGAKFSATAKGVGLSADVQIDATGSIDMNGTEYIDTCGRY